MRIRRAVFALMLTALGAGGATFDAAHPPTVRGLTGVPAGLVGNAFVERFSGALEQTLSRHPNLAFKGNVETVPVSAQSRAMPPQALDVTVDYVIYAEIVDRSVDADSGEVLTNVDVRLFDPSARSDRDVFGFLAKDTEAEEYAEIAVDALVKRLLRRRLGVLSVVTASPPGGIAVTALGEDVREIAATAFATSPRSGGYETLSPLLLEGDYSVSLTGMEGAAKRVIRVVAESRAELDFRVAAPPPQGTPAAFVEPSRALPSPSPGLPERIVMSGVGDGRLTRIAAGQTVYVRYGVAGVALELLLRRGASGPPALLWGQGFRAEQFRVDGNDAVTLRDVPYGEYIVGTWRREPSAYGKTVVAGTGVRGSFRLSAREASFAVPATAAGRGGARLRVVWSEWGPPEGAALWVDDVYVADIFDSGEASVVGLPVGARVLRFEARGYEPFERVVSLRADRESVVFVGLRPSAR